MTPPSEPMSAELTLTEEQVVAWSELLIGWYAGTANEPFIRALCNAALAHLRSQPAGYVSAWIPVSERLPEPEKGADFVPVLFNIKGTPKSVCAGRFLSGKKLRFRWRSLQGLECTDADVTHWMPLPAPPAGEGADRP